jgi:hypothetical protein
MLSWQAWNDPQARMVIDPAVPVDERTDSFLPFADTATPHATVSGQACTMTRMHGQFFFPLRVKRSCPQHKTRQLTQKMSTKT